MLAVCKPTFVNQSTLGAMPSSTQALILMAIGLAITVSLLFPMDLGETKALMVFTESHPHKLRLKRILAVAFLAVVFSVGLYASHAQGEGLISIAFIAPLPAFVLLFSVVSSRLAESYLVRPFAAYLALAAIAAAAFDCIP